jgi:hypothetical protein
MLWLSLYPLPTLSDLIAAYHDDDADVFHILTKYTEWCVEREGGGDRADIPQLVARMYMEKFYLVSALEKLGAMLFFRDTITSKLIPTIVGSVDFDHVHRWQASSDVSIRAAFVVAVVEYIHTGSKKPINSM